MASQEDPEEWTESRQLGLTPERSILARVCPVDLCTAPPSAAVAISQSFRAGRLGSSGEAALPEVNRAKEVKLVA